MHDEGCVPRWRPVGVEGVCHAAWNSSGSGLESQWDSKRSPISAKKLLLAEKYGKVGERYIIAKQFLTYQELFGLVAAKGGHKPPKQMPLSVAYAAGWIGEHLAKLCDARTTSFARTRSFSRSPFGNSTARRLAEICTGNRVR